MQTIRFLLAIPKVAEAANSLNHNGFPALGVIEHSPRDLKRIEIRHVLVDPGVKSSANNLLNCIPPLTPPPLIASTHAGNIRGGEWARFVHLMWCPKWIRKCFGNSCERSIVVVDQASGFLQEMHNT